MTNGSMKKAGKPKFFPGATLSGGIAFALSVILAVFDGRLASLPLFGFVGLCAVAPFFPRFGFFLPIISRGSSGKRAVALTFDDGPDPATTPQLLELLASYGAPATFFLTGQRADAHPGLVNEILSRGHEVGNHSYHHDPLLMLKGKKTLKEEILRAQESFHRLGFHPLAFRPPAGIVGPRLEPVLRDAGMFALTFSRRAFDMGNRRLDNLSKKILGRIRPDDIILLHDTCPASQSLAPLWLKEVDGVLRGIRDRGLKVLPLSALIGRPVMRTQGQGTDSPLGLWAQNAPAKEL